MAARKYKFKGENKQSLLNLDTGALPAQKVSQYAHWWLMKQVH